MPKWVRAEVNACAAWVGSGTVPRWRLPVTCSARPPNPHPCDPGPLGCWVAERCVGSSGNLGRLLGDCQGTGCQGNSCLDVGSPSRQEILADTVFAPLSSPQPRPCRGHLGCIISSSSTAARQVRSLESRRCCCSPRQGTVQLRLP